MKTSELLLKHLEAEEVEYIFGVPVSPIMPLYHAMAAPGAGIKPIITKHEGGAAFMADGYARVSGKLGVCLGTTGPGTTNLMTGIACSYEESIPVLVLTGQVPTSAFGKGVSQECTGGHRSFSSVELLKPICKASMMVLAPDNLSFIVRGALRAALSPRMGPVHLNIPSDVLRREAHVEAGSIQPYRVDSGCFNRDMVKKAAKTLLNPTFLVNPRKH